MKNRPMKVPARKAAAWRILAAAEAAEVARATMHVAAPAPPRAQFSARRRATHATHAVRVGSAASR